MKRSEVRVLSHPPEQQKYKIFLIDMSALTLHQPHLKSSLVHITDTEHKLTIEPLIPGFGYTLGNSIRRVLLSSIQGFAVTRIRINDITHEYQAINGVVEDAIELILNLKSIRAKILTTDDSVTVSLKKKGAGKVFVSDFETEGKVQFVNPDLYLCSLDNSGDLTLEIEISRGEGYLSNDEIQFANNSNPHDIYVDALFSPISNVQLVVDQVRVGERTDFDKITLTFHNDKTVDSEDIVRQALDLIIDIFDKMRGSLFGGSITSVAKNDDNESVISIGEEIDLPKRLKAILEKNEITTLSQLKSRIDEVEEFAGVTEKAMQTIREYIQEL
jgi:DNA-directed RNA polymerase subunit alpha